MLGLILFKEIIFCILLPLNNVEIEVNDQKNSFFCSRKKETVLKKLVKDSTIKN